MRYAALLVGIIFLSCTQGERITVDAVPDRLTPVANAIVIELEAPNWFEVCVRHFPANPQKYTCWRVEQMRQWAQPTLRANN